MKSTHGKDGRDKAQEAERRSGPRPPRLLCPAADSSVFTLVPFCRQTWRPGQKECLAVKPWDTGLEEGSQKFLEAEGKLPPKGEGRGQKMLQPTDA